MRISIYALIFSSICFSMTNYSDAFIYTKSINPEIIIKNKSFIYKKIISDMYNQEKYGIWYNLTNPKNIIKTFSNDTTRVMRFSDDKRRMILLPIRRFKKPRPELNERVEKELNEMFDLYKRNNISVPEKLIEAQIKLKNRSVKSIVTYGIYLEDGLPKGPSKNDRIFLYKGIEY